MVGPGVNYCQSLRVHLYYCYVKQCICNASFDQLTFPHCCKKAIIRPRLKKPNLDPDDVASCISTHSFSVKRCRESCWCQTLWSHESTSFASIFSVCLPPTRDGTGSPGHRVSNLGPDRFTGQSPDPPFLPGFLFSVLWKIVGKV